MHKMVDTTQTKIFVGGLPWETQRDTVQWYFEQFGEIIEAVVINDKITGRSKGYGFVTFKEPESAERACENPNPVIDGRRANCNLAILGAQKSPPATAPQPQLGGLRPKLRAASSSRPFISTSAYFNHYNPQYALIPYSNYAYNPFYQQNVMQKFNCNGYGSPGVYYSPYPCLYLLPPARGQSSYAAEPPTGKHLQLPLSPRVHQLMYGKEQVQGPGDIQTQYSTKKN